MVAGPAARCRRVVAVAALIALALAESVPARADVAIPAEMPTPDTKRCSAAQEVFMRRAWRRTHHFAWRTDDVLPQTLVDFVVVVPLTVELR